MSGVFEARRPVMAKVVARDEPAELILDRSGVILDCNAAGERLFHLGREHVLQRHVSTLFPQLADMELMEDGEPTARFRFLCSIGCGFKTLGGDGERFVSELFVNSLGNAGPDHLRLIVRRS